MLFRGRYYWASMFADSPIAYRIGDDKEDTIFPTGEHLYQALKYVDRPSIMKMIAELKTPVEAKKIGNEINAISEHLKDSYRIGIMQKVIDLKYELPLYKAYLLSTKDEYITHDVIHWDKFFGVKDGEGRNHLGLMLMDKRDDLKEEAKKRAILSSYDMELNARLILDPRKATLRIAGIGSRDLPEDIGKQIDHLMEDLNDYTNGKLIVHTGDADGADLRFKKNAVNCISYIPSKGFNGSESNLYEVSKEAKILASFHHPYFEKMKPYTQNLMGRNVYQIMSDSFNYWVDCVICYTPDGAERAEDVKVGVTGGTGLAIALADTLGIPVFNLKNDDAIQRIQKFYYFYKNRFFADNDSAILKEEIKLDMPLYHISKDNNLDKNLDNDKPLYLCHNPNEWFPSHLSEEEKNKYNTYTFRFKDIHSHNIWYTNSFDVYHSLLDFKDIGVDKDGESIGIHTPTDKLNTLLAKGCSKHFNNKVFILLKDNDRNELSEMFVINPKDNLELIYSNVKDKSEEDISFSREMMAEEDDWRIKKGMDITRAEEVEISNISINGMSKKEIDSYLSKINDFLNLIIPEECSVEIVRVEILSNEDDDKVLYQGFFKYNNKTTFTANGVVLDDKTFHTKRSDEPSVVFKHLMEFINDYKHSKVSDSIDGFKNKWEKDNESN